MQVRRWLLVAGLVAGALVCVRLAVWQLDRLHQRRALNRRMEAARWRPEVDLGGAASLPTDSLLWRRVRVRGRFDASFPMALRNRSLGGVPGVVVVQPLRWAGADSGVLVERGWLPAPDGATVDLAASAEPGSLEVAGLALPLAGRGPRPRAGPVLDDAPQARARVPYGLRSLVLRRLPGPGVPNWPRALAAPELSDGPHLSYALQWFFFAALFLAGAVFAARARPRPRPSQP
ncbi:MAG TPA: SURF1 family protein [Candidatus Saccharimonadales bacterium]|nr:SURF1 family protein [Candidatus Saccharimonadales bacterium]